MGMKVGQVAKLTGFPASTIRYYVKEGLLQEPEKVNKKMGYYDESCIERLKTIQKLQEKRFPLSSIKNILDRVDQGISLEEAEAVEDAVFGLPIGEADRLLDREEYMEMTGLTRYELEELEKVGLIMPFISEKGQARYDPEDVMMGKNVFKMIFKLNLSPKEIEFYLTLGREITQREHALRKKIIRNMAVTENLKLTLDLTSAANMSRGYFLRRLFQRQAQEIINNSKKRKVNKA
ncbi:MAG TPA: MerR family transcriptional regulator [Deltaproteobacteria bacterium]|nr:MerR family transcriptional regulator [Deltaproteobacteria bacterium]